MVLRLTYQVKKIADGSSDVEMNDLPEDWFTCLFEVNISLRLNKLEVRK
jgi:hypothetical protein